MTTPSMWDPHADLETMASLTGAIRYPQRARKRRHRNMTREPLHRLRRSRLKRNLVRVLPLLVFAVIGYFLGIQPKNLAVLRLTVSDYEGASVCLMVTEGDSSIWPQAGVTLSSHLVSFAGPGLVRIAVGPDTDARLLEAGVLLGVPVEEFDLTAPSSLAAGAPLIVGDTLYMSLVSREAATREGVAAVSVRLVPPSGEVPVNCPGREVSTPPDPLRSFFDVGVSAFGNADVLVSLEATGESAEDLGDVVGDEIAVSSIASILGSPSSFAGLQPVQWNASQLMREPFALPVRLVESDEYPALLFGAPGDAAAEVIVAGLGEMDWVMTGFMGEVAVDGGDAIDIREEDKLAFTTPVHERQTRQLTIEANGDVGALLPATAMSINGRSAMPPRTEILRDLPSQVWWWAVFGYFGYLMGSMRRRVGGVNETLITSERTGLRQDRGARNRRKSR